MGDFFGLVKASRLSTIQEIFLSGSLKSRWILLSRLPEKAQSDHD
tara:strand:- start:156 stop:290 length:135 start_codon:yes stop_codon:yes gene_type:complete